MTETNVHFVQCSQLLRHQFVNPFSFESVVGPPWPLKTPRLRGSRTLWSLAIGTIGSRADPIIPPSSHMSPTAATNLQRHPYPDAQTPPEHIHCSALNTCSRWNTRRRQSDFIRETCPPKYIACTYDVDICLLLIYKRLQKTQWRLEVNWQWILHVKVCQQSFRLE